MNIYLNKNELELLKTILRNSEYDLSDLFDESILDSMEKAFISIKDKISKF